MTKLKLKAHLMAKGIESAFLDDIVHDAASSLASNANNAGLDGQIDFLLDTCDWDAQAIIAAIEGNP